MSPVTLLLINNNGQRNIGLSAQLAIHQTLEFPITLEKGLLFRLGHGSFTCLSLPAFEGRMIIDFKGIRFSYLYADTVPELFHNVDHGSGNGIGKLWIMIAFLRKRLDQFRFLHG